MLLPSFGVFLQFNGSFSTETGNRIEITLVKAERLFIGERLFDEILWTVIPFDSFETVRTIRKYVMAVEIVFGKKLKPERRPLGLWRIGQEI